MHPDTQSYIDALSAPDREIGTALARSIDKALPDAENKIWHRHPVWFLDGNPVVGFSKLKNNMHLLFWSGQTFTTPGLQPEGSFKAAEVRYTSAAQVDKKALQAWLLEAREIQWDYKHIVKRRGRLERLL